MVNYEPFFSHIAKSMKRSEIRELLKLTAKPGIISFAGGLPAPDLFPIDDIKEMSRIVMEREGKTALQYGPTEGDNRLREELAKLMQKDGVNITSNHLLIVTSSQQGLDLVGKIFVDPGDVVMTSRPTYVGAIQAFNSYGAKMIGIEQDEEGTQTALLEAEIEKLAAKGVKPKFIYEIPDFQNPSGITMSLKRRKELMRIAEKYDLIIVEDSPYRQLRFEGKTEPSLLGMNPERVLGALHLQQDPAARLPPGLDGRPQRTDPEGGDGQAVGRPVLSALQPGHPLRVPAPRPAGEADHRHHQGLPGKARLHARPCCPSTCPSCPGLKWTQPHGGLFLWVTMPESIDAGEMFHSAIEKQVAYVVGTAFYPDGGGHNSFRMNFSYSSMAEIEEGVKRLAEVIRTWKGEPGNVDHHALKKELRR